LQVKLLNLIKKGVDKLFLFWRAAHYRAGAKFYYTMPAAILSSIFREKNNFFIYPKSIDISANSAIIIIAKGSRDGAERGEPLRES